MWSGMIRSFFVPFRFQLLFSFASHLNCKVSSFKFLFGQFAICLDSISFNLIWNTLFQGLKRFVSRCETKCFSTGNKSWHGWLNSPNRHSPFQNPTVAIMIPQIKTITNIRNPFLLVMEIMIKIIEQTYFLHYQSGTKFQKKCMVSEDIS